ncbi:hypothetical protein HYV71_00790 [Candidatus Uhrbacteria bacterium]|nr:hypothetical protein [Candidatus Uhrbacteria bacterium]
MFDLLEEELSTKEESSRASGKTPPSIDAVVYAMPEKFRRGATKSNAKPILIIAVIFLLLAVTGGILFFVFYVQNDAPQSSISVEEEQSVAVEEQQEKPLSEEDSQQPTEEEQVPSDEPSAPLPETETPVALEPGTETPSGSEPLSEETIQEEATQPQLPTIVAVDSDQDGLTDTEERLYNTNSQIQDTDGDGFTDGEEVEHLFDPIRPDGARLEISGRVTPYTNPTFSYSLYYPSSWSARAVNDSDREVVISSALGEFISVKVQDNPQTLGAIDWYIALVDPSADTSQLQSLSFNNWSGVMAPDGLAAYFVKTDETGGVIAPYVYSFLYNQNTSAQPQFQTTFRMMLRSFVFTDLSFVR